MLISFPPNYIRLSHMKIVTFIYHNIHMHVHYSNLAFAIIIHTFINILYNCHNFSLANIQSLIKWLDFPLTPKIFLPYYIFLLFMYHKKPIQICTSSYIILLIKVLQFLAVLKSVFSAV